MQPVPRGHWIVAEHGFFEIPPKYMSLFYGLVVHRETSYPSYLGLCCKKDWRQQSEDQI